MKIKIVSLVLISISIIVNSSCVFAAAEHDYQKVEGRRDYTAADPLAGKLFPPEVIMRNRQELKLSKAQSEQLIKLMQEFQSGIVETQWQLEETKQELMKTIDVVPTKTETVKKVLDNLFRLENEIKRNHILLLVQMRNRLSEEQIKLLAQQLPGQYSHGPIPPWNYRP